MADIHAHWEQLAARERAGERLAEADFAELHRQADYAFRLAEQLGDRWQAADPKVKRMGVRLMERMFVDTLRRLWDKHFHGRPMRLSERYVGPDVAWVEAATNDDAEGSLACAWRYRLHRLDGRWKVTQRERRVGHATSDTSVFFAMANRRVAEMLGRRPTLEELFANIPSLAGTMRSRHFKIPKGIGRPSK